MRQGAAAIVVGVTFLALAAMPRLAYAQAQGSITGVVKDTSGAVLPGVTVEASSPSIIEKTRSAVTDGTGQYRFINLFPGSYTVTFTLGGFNTVKREGIEVTGAFVATINAEMKVGAVTETITVTGETPIVDVQSTTKQRVITRDIIDAVPTSRIPYELAVLVPGVTARNGAGTAAVQDVGGTAGNQQANSLVVHGSKPVDMRLTYNGLTLATLETGKNAGAINNSTAYQEITVDSGAVSAELGTGGPRINLIPREGGNTFKGTVFGSYTSNSLQGDNLTQDLQSRGLTVADSVKALWDFNPGFGGPLVKDKLWFYTTVRHNGWQLYPGGSVLNANAGNPSVWTYLADKAHRGESDNYWEDAQARVTWQATPRNKVAFTYNQQKGITRGVSATASPETIVDAPFDPKKNIFGDWTIPITNRLLFEAVGVRMVERQAYKPTASQSTLIGVNEQSTGVTYRGNTALALNYWNTNYYYRASVSYVTGAHALRFGFNNAGGERDFNATTLVPPVSYRFNNGVPNQITEQAIPYAAVSFLDADGGIFAQDRWTLNRLTVTLGVRYDYYKSSFPDQSFGPGILVPNRNFTIPAQDGVRGWHNITPKTGVVYDLFGNGKTALRGTANKYVQGQALGGGLPDRPFGFPLNPVSRLVNTTTRSWTDRNSNFIPDCDLTNPAAQTVTGGDICGAMAASNFGTGSAATTYDPAILGGWGNRPGYNWEFSAGVQQEVMPRVSVDFGYFRRMFGNLLLTDNLAVAASDYTTFNITAPVDARLPGGGGYTISGVADLNPNKFGLPANNFLTYSDNYGKQIDHWNGFDLSINARPRDGLFFQGGVSAGKTTQDNCEVVKQAPEVMFGILGNAATVWTPQQYCHYESPMLAQYKLLGSYSVPKIDVQVSGTFQSVPGPELAANYVLPTAVAATTLGRPLSGGAANITVNLIQPGSLFGDRHNQLDLRFAKILRIQKTRSAINVDLYNALNSSPVLAENSTFTVWRTPTSILQARFVKFSLQFDF